MIAAAGDAAPATAAGAGDAGEDDDDLEWAAAGSVERALLRRSQRLHVEAWREALSESERRNWRSVHSCG